MEKYRRDVKFKDKKGNMANVHIEISEDGRFSMTGEHGGGCGQIDGHIVPKNKAQKELMLLWARYHLNDMKAGCAHQYALKWDEVRIDPAELPDSWANRDEKGIIATWVYKKDHPKGLLCEPCPVCGYKYGTAWLKEELPGDIRERVTKICADIETIEKEEADALPKISWEDIEDDRIVALGRFLNDISPAEAKEDISDEGGNTYCYAGTDYLVLTGEEADEKCRECLVDDPELWKQAVQAGSTTQSLEEWADDVISMDGRGSILNHWDGEEGEIEVNGTVYYIYQQ